MDKAAAPRRDTYHHGSLRAALLEASEAELEEKGVEGFTLRGCAKRAGVSHAAPAHHFGDADGLLTALAARGFERFAAAMRARQAQAGGENRAPLDAAGLGYLDFALAERALFRLMFSSSRPDFGNAELRTAAGAAFTILADAVEKARGADPWGDRAGPVDIAAAWALAHGFADLLMSGRLDFLGEGEGGAALMSAVLARLVLVSPAQAPG